MGRARIVSGGDAGHYTVRVLYDVDGINKTYAAINHRINSLQQLLFQLDEMRDEAEADIPPLEHALDEAVLEWNEQAQKYIDYLLRQFGELKDLKAGVTIPANTMKDRETYWFPEDDISKPPGYEETPAHKFTDGYNDWVWDVLADLPDGFCSVAPEFCAAIKQMLADEPDKKLEKELERLQVPPGHTVYENTNPAGPSYRLSGEVSSIEYPEREPRDRPDKEHPEADWEFLDAERPDHVPVIRAAADLRNAENYLSLLEATIDRKIAEIESLELKKEELQTLQNLLENDVRGAWCVDYTEDLSGEHQTIEVNGEPGHIILSPGFLAPGLFKTDLFTLTAQLAQIESQINIIRRNVENLLVPDPPLVDPIEPREYTPGPEKQQREWDPTWVIKAPERDPVDPIVLQPQPIDESEPEEEDPEGQAITGTVLEEETMAALENVRVTVYRKEGSGDSVSYSFVRSTSTGADGTYELKGLSAGTYRLKFEDPPGNYLTEYYNNKPTLDLSNDIHVPAAGNVTGINAVLGIAATISGTVTG